MTREEFIKQRCEIDKITEEEFEEIYRVVECNCGKPYCKGFRCLDLDDLLKENQELKKQLEEKNKKYIPGEYATETFIKTIDENILLKNQQKDFIKYLEDEINKWNYNYDNYNYEYEVEEPTAEELANKILQKYKSIIGCDK